MMFASVNLVGGAAIGAGLALATTAVAGDDGCLAATSFTGRFLAFGLLFSTAATDA